MIAFYISGHGFGHASRDIEVLNALGRLAPDVPVAVRTSAPKWLFDLTLTRPVDFTSRECDTGIVQIDSLSLDEAATVAPRVGVSRAARRDGRRRRPSGFASIGARLVVGDIPPLACAAGHAAGLPVVALGNFTWDWIYDGYRDWLARAPTSSSGSATRTPWPTRRSACRCMAASRRCATSWICRSSPGSRCERRPTRAHVSGCRSIGRWCCSRLAGTACSESTSERWLTSPATRLSSPPTSPRTVAPTRSRQAPTAPVSRPTCSSSTSTRCTGTACGMKTWLRLWTS